ncbi:peptide/nickel transport system substrate-binding protein [Quadrisphaera granulorum]|uniref:Peptide/nickel transport system substrate-binding protein n=1 Tax=Quadrisphaera granulorum TaxID=317664 RepID=A0A316A8J1_9ACTN|nr:ABC transporter substrate-binding protein [Quadrisphaera granulorum]PWJ53508.1 peptide/nickel transport system substrate-binding protein [Quadrisphaera granulorum]SZE96850.1 peptide/nickel transport system substrate-binding protein [Quadrisphaera granulorum]
MPTALTRARSAPGRTFASAVALATASVLSACSGSTPSQEPPAAGGRDAGFDVVNSLAAGRTPVESVTWALAEGEPSSLDPALGYSYVTPNLCENLLLLNEDFSVSEHIAQRAEWSTDTTFVIELRDDVTFWDGSPVTAADVVYSLSRNLQPSSNWYSPFFFVTDIAQTGDLEVTLTFSQHSSQFREVLSGGAGAVMQKAYGESVGDAVGTAETGLMCTGPFMVEKGGWTPGTSITTRANPAYWNGTVLAQEITYVFVPDSTSLTSALLSGEVDGAFGVPTSAAAQFTESDAGQFVVGDSTGFISIMGTSPQSPAAIAAVRRALGLAIDRAQFLETILHGYGTEMKTLVPPFIWSGSPVRDIYDAGYASLPDIEHDVERARELIAESGADLSEPMVMAVPAGNTEAMQTALIVQAAGEAIGLTIEIDEKQPADYGALYGDPALRDTVDLMLSVDYIAVPAFVAYTRLNFMPTDRGGYFNWTGYSNEAVIAGLDEAATATDATAAAKAYVAAQDAYVADLPVVPLAATYQTTFLAEGLTGVVTSKASVSSPWALHLGGRE